MAQLTYAGRRESHGGLPLRCAIALLLFFIPRLHAAHAGEMKDTVQMNPAGAYVLERFFSRAERQKLFRSWAGSASMWIKGGDAIWGSPHGAPDDAHGCDHTHGELIAFRVPPPPPGVKSTSKGVEAETRNMTADKAGAWILQHTPSSFQVSSFTCLWEGVLTVGTENDRYKFFVWY